MPTEYAIQALDDWLQGAGRRLFNVDLADLFYWEQRMGSWQAMSQSEWDIVQEVFTPFNCRRLLVEMLGVAPRHRTAPGFRLQKAIIRRLWPAALREPINPHLYRAPSVQGRIAAVLRGTPLYPLLRSLKHRIGARGQG
jgi:hypothetical protein